MYDIKCNLSEVYANSISQFIKREFPVFVKPDDHDLLDLLTDAIIGSKQNRLGSRPSPESLVEIRKVITHWTSHQMPIPFLIGWGSEKPDGSGIDIAELFAMKTLNCLNERVKQFYPAGVQFNIRIEDASAPHLFFDRMDDARKEAALYTNGFVNLARVLGWDSFIKLIPESTMTTEETFNKEADTILPIMELHVNDVFNQDARNQLAMMGWKVPLSPDTIGYFTDRYAKLYPEKTEAQQRHLLSRYFAAALARYTLGITGVSKDWQGNFLELSFVQPTPGIGTNRAMRRIYYRTMPCNITTNHVPAWRGKGYLKINDCDDIHATVTSFNCLGDTQFNPNTITLTDGGIKQDVQADYILTD